MEAFSSVFPRKSFLGFSQAGLVSTKKVRKFFRFFLRLNLNFFLKLLKRNAKFSKTQNWGNKEMQRKKITLGHRPSFPSPIDQISAHNENAGWMEDQNFRSPFVKKIINENRNLFASYLWHVFGENNLENRIFCCKFPVFYKLIH